MLSAVDTAAGHAALLAATPAQAPDASAPPRVAAARAIVLDTNIVLDLFVFSDTATAPLRAALDAHTLRWLATPVMREELSRVLAYTHIIPRMAHYQVTAQDVLAQFDARVQVVDVAPKARYVCKDADDQQFIDLAVAHQAGLLSKDKAVLTMAKRLRPLGVQTASTFAALSSAWAA